MSVLSSFRGIVSVTATRLQFFGWRVPRNAALHGASFDHHLRTNLWIFLALLVLAHLVLFAGVTLRRKPQPLTHRRWRLELLPLAALTALFLVLAYRSQRMWADARYSGADPAAMQLEAAGMQFAWYFRYPGKDAAFGSVRPDLVEPGSGNPAGIDPSDPRGKDDFVRSELVVPVGREIDLRLRALDVIHGFSVPEFRIKQNAIPGEIFHIHFTPVRVGQYAVLCTQVCGLGHYRMQAVIRVVPQDEFAEWIRKQEAAQ